jgi:hypothetical protein
MLAISPTASAVITNALAQAEAPDGAGLRLAAGELTDRGMAIEPTTAELLADQMLDAEVKPDQITFSLRPQPQDPSMNGRTP